MPEATLAEGSQALLGKVNAVVRANLETFFTPAEVNLALKYLNIPADFAAINAKDKIVEYQITAVFHQGDKNGEPYATLDIDENADHDAEGPHFGYTVQRKRPEGEFSECAVPHAYLQAYDDSSFFKQGWPWQLLEKHSVEEHSRMLHTQHVSHIYQMFLA